MTREILKELQSYLNQSNQALKVMIKQDLTATTALVPDLKGPCRTILIIGRTKVAGEDQACATIGEITGQQEGIKTGVVRRADRQTPRLAHWKVHK